MSELAAADRQAGRARAGRQVGQRDPRRRRPRARPSRDGVGKCFLNSGQTCTRADPHARAARRGSTRPSAIAAAAVEPKYTVGDPFDRRRELGPLVSDAQRERVRGYIQKGIDEGAKLVTGGAETPEGLEQRLLRAADGVLRASRNDMTIAQEEIFGPVLSIIPYDDEDDAVRIANDSIYGLAGGVWSADEERAKRVARRIRTGQVEINGGAFNPLAPFGGYKQSGHGRELGQLRPRGVPRGQVDAALMDFEPSPRCAEFKERLSAFMDEHVYPAEPVYEQQMRESGDPHHQPAGHGGAQGRGARARACGTCSCPTPSGRRRASPTSTTRRSPRSSGRSHDRLGGVQLLGADTGNMEVLHQFGTARAEGALAAPAARRRDPLRVRDDRARRRQLGRHQHRDARSSATATTTCSTGASGGPRTRCTPTAGS